MSLRRPFSEDDTGPLLTLGDRVVWLFEHGPEHGWVRWIGRIPVVSPSWTIGVEFDNPIGAGDGKFGGKRYFYARNDHAYFLPNSSLLRASDYNSCFRKQSTVGGPMPSPQSKVYTLPHQFSAAKCPFPGPANAVEATHLTAAHLISAGNNSKEHGICSTGKLLRSQSTCGQDGHNLSDYDNWLGGRDPCNVHVKSWKSSSTHSVVSCPPVLLPKMLVAREPTSSSDSEMNFGSLRSLMSCFTLGSHRKKKRRKKKKKSHRLVIVTSPGNSNCCYSGGNVGSAPARTAAHLCEGEHVIQQGGKELDAKELSCVSGRSKAIWRYSLQEQDMQRSEASSKEPVTSHSAEQKMPPKLPPKTSTKKKRLAPQPPDGTVTPVGTLPRNSPVAVPSGSSAHGTDSLSLSRRRSHKKPAPQPPGCNTWHSAGRPGALPSGVQKGVYANENTEENKALATFKTNPLQRDDVGMSRSYLLQPYSLKSQLNQEPQEKQDFSKNLVSVVIKPDLPVKTIPSSKLDISSDKSATTEASSTIQAKDPNDYRGAKAFDKMGKPTLAKTVVPDNEERDIGKHQAFDRETRSSTLPSTRQCSPILEEEEPYATTAVCGEFNNLESVLKRNSNVFELLDAFSKLEINSDETPKDNEPESPKHQKKQAKSLKSLFQKHPADASKVVSTKWTYTPMEAKKENVFAATKPTFLIGARPGDNGNSYSKVENADDPSLLCSEIQSTKKAPSQLPMNTPLASCRMNLKPVSHSPDFGNVFCKLRSQASGSSGNPPWKNQLQALKAVPDEPRPSTSELRVGEAKNKTSGGRKEGWGSLVGESASCSVAAATAGSPLEVMAGKASPMSSPVPSALSSAHTSPGRQRPPAHPNSPTALMQAKLPVLFRQLEEAISKGEHDRAAILARELAMYKVSCSLRRVRRVAPDPKQFTLKMYVEDRKSHVGPISLPVYPEMTLSNLKKKVEAEYNIPVRVQRWILGKNLATEDEATLEQFGVSHSACPVFLYLVSPAEELKAEEVLQNKFWKPPDSVASSTEEVNELAPTSLGQVPSDASSTLDALLNDQAAGWTCQLCGINNTEPDTCAMCGVAAVADAIDHSTVEASHRTVDTDTETEPIHRYDLEPTEVHTNENNQLMVDNDPVEVGFAQDQDESHAEEPKQPPQPLLPQDYMRLVELDGQDLVPSMEAFECSVCFLGVEPGQGILLRDCLHMFCRDCLSNSVRYAEEATVKCPFRNDEYSCSSHLQEREIRALVSPEVYEHHLSRSVKTAESQAPNSFHCKTADCPGWCMLEDNVNVFLCPVCGHSNCLTCRAIHEGKNCLQYQDELDFNAPNGQEAKQTKEYLDLVPPARHVRCDVKQEGAAPLFAQNMVKEGQAMHCPQCRVIVMKKWGCDWLKCSVCQTEICWVTKGPRWGPQGKGDTSAGCKCGMNGVKCHPKCNYCH